MVPSIKIFSREKFNNYIIENWIKDSTAYICIISSDEDPSNHILWNIPYKYRIISQFDDIDIKGLNSMFVDNGPFIKPINSQNAKSIYGYIKENINKQKWIIHCDAGFSRSSAVGVFLSQYLDYLLLSKIYYWTKDNINELKRYWKLLNICESNYINYLLQYNFCKHPNDKVLKELYQCFKDEYGFYLQEIFN